MNKFYSILSRIWLISIFSIVLGACVDIDDLSNENSIARFTVTSHQPESIELGAVEISSDTIYIPILFGIYDLPLKFKAHIDITDNIDKVIGFDSNKEFVFNTLGDELKFYVMAKSGLTRTYIITPKVEANLSDGNKISRKVEITNVVPTSLASLISENATYSRRNDTLTIHSVGGSYPISITPTFTIPESASFVDFKNGEVNMKFESAKQTFPITVKSASGKDRVWKVALNTTPIITGDNIESFTANQLHSTDIDVSKCSISSSQVENPSLRVNNSSNTITIKLPIPTVKGATYPLDFNFKFESYPSVELFGITNESKVSFSSLSAIKKFYLLDPTEGVSREWNIVLSQATKEDIKISGVTFDYTAGTIVTEAKYIGGEVVETTNPCIVLDNQNIQIRPASYEIIIPTSNFRTSAILQNPYHNYKSDRDWSINITNLKLQLTNGETTDLPSTWSMTSNYEADAEGKDGNGAKQNNCWQDVQTFKVVSADGSEELWTIRLNVDRAEVESINILDPTPGFDISDELLINNNKGQILLQLNNNPNNTSYPLRVNIGMVVSQGATSSIPLRGYVEFKDITSKVNFTVTSERGVVKPWSMVLDYRPQIPFSNFDIWSKRQYNKPQPSAPWQTANTPVASAGTYSEDRAGNGKVAVMKAESILGKFAAGSIFLGNFEFNAGIGINDPISLTYFGTPFQATSKIKGIEVEINYSGGTGKKNNHGMKTAFDYGSCVIELVNYNNKLIDPEYKNYQYHGLYSDGTPPRTAGRENNATSVVKGLMFFANSSGAQHEGTTIEQVDKGVWEKIFIPFKYIGETIPAYTHIHIVFSGSARGDFFCGYKGSILKVDNVKLVYE